MMGPSRPTERNSISITEDRYVTMLGSGKTMQTEQKPRAVVELCWRGRNGELAIEPLQKERQKKKKAMGSLQGTLQLLREGATQKMGWPRKE